MQNRVIKFDEPQISIKMQRHSCFLKYTTNDPHKTINQSIVLLNYTSIARLILAPLAVGATTNISISHPLSPSLCLSPIHI